jgi:hypothetical protein
MLGFVKWNYYIDHGARKARDSDFNFSSRLSRFLNSDSADFSKGSPLFLLIPYAQKKWQLRHPVLDIFTSALFIGSAGGKLRRITC